MSLVIDVAARSDAAEQQLQRINKQLSELVRSSNMTAKALGGLNVNNLKQTTTHIHHTTSALGRMGKVGSHAINSILLPAKAVTSTLFSLKFAVVSVISALAAVKGVGAFNSMADDLTRVQNRLRLVTKDAAELAKTQRELYNIAKLTRTGFSDTSSVFFNLARAMSETGASSRQLFGLTKTIQQTIAVSGTTSHSAAAALLQLNQGLASGTLRGEELNSVLEQLPRLGLALTKSLGKNAGELRRFAEEGKLTTQLVTDVIKDQAVAIENEFNKTLLTAEQGFERLTTAIKYTIGTFNQSIGSATRWGETFSKMGEAVNTFSDNFTRNVYIFQQGIRNYIGNLDLFSVATLVAKSLLKGEISIFDIKTAYDQYSTAKALLAKVRALLGQTKEDAYSLKDAFSFKLPSFNTSNTSARTFKELLKDTIGLFSSVGYAITGLGSKLSRIVPDIRLPLRTFSNDVDKWARLTTLRISRASRKMFLPLTQAVTAATEYVSLFRLGDTALERSFVRLARSDSIKDLTENLRDLGDVARSERFANFGVIEEDLLSALRGLDEDVLAVLRYFEIIDNRVLFLNNIRLDRFIEVLRTTGSVVKALYRDVIAPTVEPIAYSIILNVQAAMQAAFGAIKDHFTVSAGERLGNAIVKGLVSSVKEVSSFVKKLFSKDVFSDFFNSDGAIAGIRRFGIAFKESIYAIATWFYSLITTVFDGISKAASGTFDDMLQKMSKKATELLTKISDKVAKFGKMVKDEFFDIYDKVVGHSYWPDLIDEINAYTNRLVGSESTMIRFKNKVISTMASAFAFIKHAAASTKGIVTSIAVRVGDIDIGDTGKKVKDYIEAAVLAGVLVAFGSPVMKAAGLDFFVTILGFTLGNIPDWLSDSIGRAAGTIASSFANSFIVGLDYIIASLPNFVRSFLDGLGPIGRVLSGLLSIGPSSGLIYALLFGSGIYLLKAKDGLKSIRTLITGISKDKRGKEFSTGFGLLPFVQSLTTSLTGKQLNLSGKLFGNNPKLLAAGILAISSAFLDSVSLMEAAIVGVPLILTAMLGSDGGGKATANILKAFRRIATDSYLGLVEVFKQRSSTNVLAKIMQAPIDAVSNAMLSFSNFKGSKKSVLRQNLERVLRDVVTIAGNVWRNLGAYGSGAISITDLLFKGTRGFHRNKFRKDLEKLLSGISGIQVGDSSLGKVGSNLLKGIGDTLRKGTGEVKTIISAVSANIARAYSSIASKLKSIVDSLRGPVGGLFEFITLGAGTMFNFLKSKLGIFAILTTLLTGVAFASESAAVDTSSFTSQVKYLTTALIKLTAGLAALGIATKLFLAFKKGAIADKVAAASKETDKVAAYEAFSRTALNYSEGFKSLNAEAEKLFVPVLKYLRGLSTAVFAFSASVLSATYRLSKDTILSLAWWTGLKGRAIAAIEAIKGKISAIKGGVAGAADYIGTALTTNLVKGFQALKAFIIGTIGAVIVAFGTAGTAIGGFILLLKKVATGILFLFKLPVLAFAAAGGLLATLIFGKGNTFLEKLEYVKDQITGLFGVAAKGGSARFEEVSSKLAKTKIGDIDVDFSSQLGKIDFGKLTEHQFKVLNDTATTTNETLERMRDLYEQQGELTAEQVTELKNAIKLQQQLLAREPTRDLSDQRAGYRRLLGNVGYQDTSITGGLKRALQFFGNSLVDTIDEVLGKRSHRTGIEFSKSVDSAISLLGRAKRAIGTGIGWIGKAIYWLTLVGPIFEGWSNLLSWVIPSLKEVGSVLSDIYDEDLKPFFKRLAEGFKAIAYPSLPFGRQQRVDEATAKIGGLLQFEGEFTDPQVELLNKLSDEYGEAERKLAERLEKGFFSDANGNGIRVFREEVRKLTDESTKARTELYRYADALHNIGRRSAQLKSYTKRITSLSDFAKDAGIDFGKDNLKFLGGPGDTILFEIIAKRRDGFIKRLRETGDEIEIFDLKKSIARSEEDLKQLFERINAKAFLKTDFEYQIKVSGIDTTIDELSAMFAYNSDGYRKWQKAISNVAEAQRNLDQSDPSVDPANYRLRLAALNKAKKEAEAARPAVGEFKSINALLSKAGLDAISEKSFIAIGAGALDGLKRQLKEVNDLKADFENPENAYRTFDQQVQALSVISEKLREITIGFKEAGKEGLERVLADESASARDREEAFKAYTGLDIPTNIGASINRTKAWININKKIADKGLELLKTTGAKERAELNSQIKYLEKAKNRLEEEKPDKFLSNIVSEISATGISLSIKELFDLPPATLKRLREYGKELADIQYKMDRTSYSDKNLAKLKEMGDKIERIKKFAEDTQNAFSKITAGNFLSGLQGILQFTPSQYGRMSKTIREQLLSLRAQRAKLETEKETLKLSATPTAEEIAKFDDLVARIAILDKATQKFQESNLTLVEKMNMVGSVFSKNISYEAWHSATAGARDELVDIALQIESIKRQALDTGIAANTQELKILQARGEVLAGKLSAAGLDKFAEETYWLNAAGINVSEGLRVFGLGRLREFQSEINNLQHQLLQAEEESEKERLRKKIYMSKIYADQYIALEQDIFDDAFKTLTQNVKLMARQAGGQFADNVLNSFSEMLKGRLKSEKPDDSKGFWVGWRDKLLDDFTSNVLDTTVDGAMRSIRDRIYPVIKSMGTDLFGFGGDLIDSVFGQVKSPFEQAVEDFKRPVSAFSDAVSYLVNALGIEGTPGLTSRLTTERDSSQITTADGLIIDSTDKTAEAVSKNNEINYAGFANIAAGIGGLARLFGVKNPILDAIGIAGTAFNAFGSISKLLGFADGGVIPGPAGAPMPVLAHGGEVVLNAAQQRNVAGQLSGTSVFNINITGDVSQQTRNEIQRMIPQIASGVNAHNYERGRRA